MAAFAEENKSVTKSTQSSNTSYRTAQRLFVESWCGYPRLGWPDPSSFPREWLHGADRGDHGAGRGGAGRGGAGRGAGRRWSCTRRVRRWRGCGCWCWG